MNAVKDIQCSVMEQYLTFFKGLYFKDKMVQSSE